MLEILPKLMTVHASATMSPGPNFALVFQVSTDNAEKRAARATVLGVTAGILIHCALAVFGVSHLMTESPAVMTALRISATLFLTYLGFLSLRGAYRLWNAGSQSSSVNQPSETRADEAFYPWFRRGFVHCLMNPKAFLYFVTVLPQGFTRGFSAAEATLILALLGGITWIWFTLVSEFFKLPAIQARLHGFKLGLNLITGGLFLSLAFTFGKALLGTLGG